MNRTGKLNQALTLFKTVTTLTVGIAMCVATSLQAATLVSVDLTNDISATYAGSATTPGGLVPLPGQIGDWNEMPLGPQFASFSTTQSLIDLLDGDGNPTNIDFYLNTGTLNFPAPRTLTNFNEGGTDALGNDFAFISDNSEVGYRFEDLLPNRAYQLRFFGQITNVDAPANFATFHAPGPVSANTHASLGYVDLLTWSNGLGEISGFFQRFETPGNISSSISGVQLLAIPEPGSMVAMGLMSCALILRRRR